MSLQAEFIFTSWKLRQKVQKQRTITRSQLNIQISEITS